MMDDFDEPKKKIDHEIGSLLDALSIDELKVRIRSLEAEIARLNGAIDSKSQTRTDAESFFKS